MSVVSEGSFDRFFIKLLKIRVLIWQGNAITGMMMDWKILEWEIPYLETGFGQAEEDAWLHQLISRLEPEIQELVLLRFGQHLTLGELRK